MNYLTSKIKQLHNETIANLRNSKAANTLRAYKSDFRDFEMFCLSHGLNAMPTEPKIISLYITQLSKIAKLSTLRRRIVSISVVHKLKGHYLDTKHPIIIENLMGIKRTNGSLQRGKKPLLINHLQSLIKVIDDTQKCEIKKARDKTIILLGFGGGFRRTELVSINYEDLEFVNEGLKILIRKSKTDQYGEGMLKALPYLSNTSYCPTITLKKWLQISNINDGPIFRRFSKGSNITSNRLSDQSVVLIIKNYLRLAGIENTNFSAHSLRSGFATVMAEFGADERSIMAMTGHKSTQMVRRYIKEANLFKNNALNKIKI